MKYSKYELEITKALQIRAVEEKLLDLYSKGYISGTVHTCIGQELNAVFVAKNLYEQDFVFSNHRGHGHYIAKTGEIKKLVYEVLGRKDGCSHGEGGSQHLLASSFMSNGIQGGMVPIACGKAFYYKRKNLQNISVVFIGDGTLGEGIVYETLNIASKLNIPLLIVVENNGIAQTTSIEQSMAGTIRDRAKAFDVSYYSASTNDIENLDRQSRLAVNYVRNETRPAVFEIKSQRLMSHSKGDDNRDPREIERLWENDILNDALNHDVFSRAYQNFQLDLDGVEKDPILPIDVTQNDEEICKETPIVVKSKPTEASETVATKIYQSLETSLRSDPDTILIGEDIETSNQYNPGKYGGAFNVTRDLSSKYPGQVINFPISEAAMIGFGTGYCLSGSLCIVEIMFGDFLTLGYDQILNHSTKFFSMYGKTLSIPLVIRSPMGARRGYGPTHSQSIESKFLGIPNLDVICINHRTPLDNYYVRSENTASRPKIIFENKVLYNKQNLPNEIGPFEVSYPFGDDIVLVSLKDRTEVDFLIVCYGEMLVQAEIALMELLEHHELIGEILCFSDLTDMNFKFERIFNQNTKLVVFPEEGSGYVSWASEFIAEHFDTLNTRKLRRISNQKTIPSGRNNEEAVIVDSRKLISLIAKEF